MTILIALPLAITLAALARRGYRFHRNPLLRHDRIFSTGVVIDVFVAIAMVVALVMWS